MAFHEASHAAASLLTGSNWTEAVLLKSKRKWAGGHMGYSLAAESTEHALIATAGALGEKLWRMRRIEGAAGVPDHGPSDHDIEIVLMLNKDWDVETTRATDLLVGHEDLVAWLARSLIRHERIDAAFVKRRLPRKLSSPIVQEALRRAMSSGNLQHPPIRPTGKP